MKNTFDIQDFVPVLTEQAIKQGLVDRFKQRRKELGLTQKALSHRSGVSYGSIRRFELTGEIALHALLKLSMAVNCLEDFNEIFKHPLVKDIRK